ncbi:MAG: response regulator transcription factor [Eubacterium sp.]|nr:response regulator transcription factor [Eubacterium sp.]
MEVSVLIVDDEVELAESTAEYFNMFDVPSKCVFNAIEAIEFLKSNTVKLILLDINLGKDSGMSGFDLCKKFRETIDVPILFISARSSDDDMVIALNIGGDDYITKPYSLNVLYAKVKAVLKRYEKTIPVEEHTQICFGDIIIDIDSAMVKKNGQYLKLTAIEYKLLVYLVTHKNRVISKNEIFDNVWEDSFVSEGTLNVHLRHLREKLEEDPNNPEYIKTVRGMGLMFNL